MNTGFPLIAGAVLALAACGPGEAEAPSPGDRPGETAPITVGSDSDDKTPYDGIAPGETVRFTGTEPFWGGSASGSTLTYSTPENVDGQTIAVDRFAGRNGLALSGELGGAPFDMAITPGSCSDGMSDRTYPFTVTLEVGGEQRRGCAWTDRQPYAGTANP